MFYSEYITFPAAQTENTATVRRLRVNRGVITTLWVQFPPGCAALTKVRLYHEGHPFVPVHKEDYIKGDNYTFKIPIMFEIKSSPEQITIEGWNEDDIHDHEIGFYILVLPKWLAYPYFMISKAIEALTRMFM